MALAAIITALTTAVVATAHARETWILAVAGVSLLLLFVLIEASRGDRAIMPLTLFANRVFSGLTLLTFFLYASFSGLMVLLPFVMIRLGGHSAVAVGAGLLPLPIVIGLGSRFMGRFAARHGARFPLTIGTLIVALGFFLYSRAAAPPDYWRDILPPTLAVALGMGICVAPLTTAVMASVDSRHVGAASGFNSAVARVAGAVATALLGFVFVLQDSAQALAAGFRGAALVGSAMAIAAAAAAFFLMRAAPSKPR